MRCSAIIVAAGSGVRLKMEAPKAFVPLGGRTILNYSLRTIAAVDEIEEAVVTVPEGMRRRAREEVEFAGLQIPVKLVIGGLERQDSVRAALALTSAEAEVVVVHDAARPFAFPSLFSACIGAIGGAEGAIAAIPAADTLKRVENRTIIQTVDRKGLWQAQTPQAFMRRILVAAHDRAARERWTVTDDADLVERCGGKVEIIEASAKNLKITAPADLEIAEAIASRIVRL
jgi:2-C-methyl-D-erythritol 4-phosphate cytidylyltransferase